MEEFEKLESLVDHGKAYARNRIEDTRLALAEKTSGVLALIIERGILAVVFLIALLFLSAAGAIALGERLGHEWKGFLIFGGGYCIIGCFLLSVRERLIRIPVMDALIRYIFNTNDDEED